MKVLGFIFIFLISQCAIAQESGATANKEVYTIVEQMAEFPGGQTAMTDFISRSLRYPKKAAEAGVGGKLFLKFIVNEIGVIDNIEVIKSSGQNLLDEEGVRVVSSMPRWRPGMQNGKTVPVYYNLPINFTLAEPYIVFNAANTDKIYLQAKELILNGNAEKAMNLLLDLKSDPDAWFCLGVLYYQKKDWDKSRRYFEDVKNKVDNVSAAPRTLSAQFLTKYFENK